MEVLEANVLMVEVQVLQKGFFTEAVQSKVSQPRKGVHIDDAHQINQLDL